MNSNFIIFKVEFIITIIIIEFFLNIKILKNIYKLELKKL
jgi:hypothetical protein